MHNTSMLAPLCAYERCTELDLTVSSFGGIDLSILPGMHGWINMTISWVLKQFTHPNYATVDFLPILCPSCATTHEDRGFFGNALWTVNRIRGKILNFFDSLRCLLMRDASCADAWDQDDVENSQFEGGKSGANTCPWLNKSKRCVLLSISPFTSL